MRSLSRFRSPAKSLDEKHLIIFVWGFFCSLVPCRGHHFDACPLVGFEGSPGVHLSVRWLEVTECYLTSNGPWQLGLGTLVTVWFVSKRCVLIWWYLLVNNLLTATRDKSGSSSAVWPFDFRELLHRGLSGWVSSLACNHIDSEVEVSIYITAWYILRRI